MKRERVTSAQLLDALTAVERLLVLVGSFVTEDAYRYLSMAKSNIERQAGEVLLREKRSAS